MICEDRLGTDVRNTPQKKRVRLCVKQEMTGDAGCVETLLL
jgi:hypothetical protein